MNVFYLDGYTTNNLVLPEPDSAQYILEENSSSEEFIKFLEMLKLHGTNPKNSYYTISEFNFLSEALKKIIDKKDIDLVVMGAKGVTNSIGLIFGSNTVIVMEKINTCPALAIPENIRFSSIKEIVFPTDYNHNYKRKELNYLIEIAKVHDAAIRILHIKKEKEMSNIQEENKLLLEAIFRRANHSFHTLSETDVSDGIRLFAESRNSNMIAFINLKHFFFNSIFYKPLAKEFENDAVIPILALH